MASLTQSSAFLRSATCCCPRAAARAASTHGPSFCAIGCQTSWRAAISRSAHAREPRQRRRQRRGALLEMRGQRVGVLDPLPVAPRLPRLARGIGDVRVEPRIREPHRRRAAQRLRAALQLALQPLRLLQRLGRLAQPRHFGGGALAPVGVDHVRRLADRAGAVAGLFGQRQRGLEQRGDFGGSPGFLRGEIAHRLGGEAQAFRGLRRDRRRPALSRARPCASSDSSDA